MKKQKLNKAVFILPLLVLFIYLIVVAGMRSAESKATHLYQQHTILLKELSPAANQSAKKAAQDRFVNSVKLSTSQQVILKTAVYGQKGIDALTLGTNHCLNTKTAGPCKVYTQEIVDAANGRYDTIHKLTGKEVEKESILFGEQYRALDFVQTVITLLIEAIAFTLIVLWLMPTVKIKDKK